MSTISPKPFQQFILNGIIDSSQDIQNKLLEWFKANGRYWIPWKLKKDGSIPQFGESISPYGIWIAEVMLQQTKLKIVILKGKNG